MNRYRGRNGSLPLTDLPAAWTSMLNDNTAAADTQRMAPGSDLAAAHPPAGGSVRWTVCAMLFFATSINYMDRQVLGILAPLLQHTIGWSESQYGYIIGGFQVAYAAGMVLSGRMIDRIGTRIGYALVMGVWSLAAMAHSLVSTVLGFGIARFFLGLGEAGNFPAAIKTTAEWFPQRERSLATGIFNSGTNVGAILAPAAVPWITLRFGWRAAFLSTGAFSMAWILWWVTRYRRPGEHPRVKASELLHIRSDAAAPVSALPWRQLMGYRQTWAYASAKFLTDPIWWFYLYWLPKFFDGRYHLGLSRLGLPLIVVYNVSAVGSIGGGWLPGMLHRRGIVMTRARLIAMLLCACLVLPVALAGSTTSLWAAVGILSLAAAAHQGWSANLMTTTSDMFPQEAVGVIVGIGGLAGALGGALFSLSTGWILQVSHSYQPLFAMAGGAYLVAWLLLQVLAPRLRPIPPPAGLA